ncbi:MAG: hypothetical protein QNJ98_01855 [Planctomycetota bacterium]|nr:hypothetical protein [Planctomycetota bacterium]
MREIETRAQWEEAMENGLLLGLAVQGLDLTGDTERILQHDFDSSLFLGCGLAPEAQHHIEAGGGTVLPPLRDLPFDAFPTHLYTPERLFAGYVPSEPDTYEHSLDGRIYAWWRRTGQTIPSTIRASLARRLHDHGISDALFDMIGAFKVVAIMGGHNLERASAEYRLVATVARALTRAGYFLASGGGPGAMEATHLGAWFAPRADDDLEDALATLGKRPATETEGLRAHEYQDVDWLARAFEVRERYPLVDRAAGRSLGIPTWHYGHEPPNAFATDIAKYFASSVREEGLLSIARYGVIYAPGSMGTIQEIFHDATQNHYGSVGAISPMIFLGRRYWTETKPVYPLLEKLAAGQPYAKLLAAVDEADEVVELVSREAVLEPECDEGI